MTQVLESLSNSIVETIEQVNASIVQVNARRRLPATGIVWSADGVVVTSHHVVERDENIHIGLADGSTLAATLLGRDPSTDLAVLQVDANLAAPTWGELEAVRVGHLVLALGRPGKDIQATIGVVSSLSEVDRSHRRRRPAGNLERYIQTDVVMYPGFSGGPLLAASGNILGMNTSIMRGASIAVPTPAVRYVVETLLAHGKMRRGYLGITAQPVALPAHLKAQLEQETGLLVVAVEPDSPADKGGLLLGDTLIALDETPVTTMDDLLGLLVGERVGATVPLQLLRGGALQTAQVTIGERA